VAERAIAAVRPAAAGRRTLDEVHDLRQRLRGECIALLRWPTVRKLARSVDHDDVLGISAEVAFYVLLALFPFLTLVAAVIGVAVDDPTLALGRFFTVMHGFMPTATAEVLTHFLEGPLRAQRLDLASVGFLMTLWAGSQGLAAMLKALNRVHCAGTRGSWMRHRALSIALLVPAVVVSALVLVVMTGDAPDGILSPWVRLSPAAAAVWAALRWPAVFLLTAWVLGSSYATVSCARRRPRWVSLGALIAALAWIGSSALLSMYWDRSASYATQYAPVGDVITLLLWIYASVAVILVGAEIDATLTATAKPAEIPAA
jgi:membrane protein